MDHRDLFPREYLRVLKSVGFYVAGDIQSQLKGDARVSSFASVGGCDSGPISRVVVSEIGPEMRGLFFKRPTDRPLVTFDGGICSHWGPNTYGMYVTVFEPTVEEFAKERATSFAKEMGLTHVAIEKNYTPKRDLVEV